MTSSIFGRLEEAGNVPHDNPPEPFSTSKTSNWVLAARAGGLPAYVQHVAHALVEKGETESRAIEKAVGIVRNWSEGKQGVSKAVQAAAAKAMAEWEKKRASAKAKSAVSENFVHDRLGNALILVQEHAALFGGSHLLAIVQEGKLSSKERDQLPDSSFALPGRRYPIHDKSHALNALSRVAQNGSDDEKKKVRAAVHAKYPNLGKTEEAEALGTAERILRESVALIEAAPNWMIPMAARQPGFKPLKPEKTSTSSNTEFNRLHPRGTGAQGGQFIEKGTSGSEVTAIQHRLGVTRTGTVNGQTVKAIERFQRNHNIQVDGVIGKQTVAAMRGTTTGVAPGALTKNDRRFLRRYARRTGA